MVNIKNELKGNSILLSIFSNRLYNNSLTSLLKGIGSEKICYVSLNQTTESLMKNFQSKTVNTENIFFIDAITSSSNKYKKIDNGILVSSPYAFTELSIAINEALKSKMFSLVVFDSLSTLKIYGNENSAIRFTSAVMNKIRKEEHKGIFTCLEGDVETNLIGHSAMHADKVLKYKIPDSELKADRIKKIGSSLAFILVLLGALSFLNTGNKITAFASVSLPDGTTQIPVLFFLAIIAVIILIYRKAVSMNTLGVRHVNQPVEIPDKNKLRAKFKRDMKVWFNNGSTK